MVARRQVLTERRPFWRFFTLALVISWGFWIPTLWAMASGERTRSSPYRALMTGGWLDTPNPFHGLLLTIGLFGPLLAASFLIARRTGAANLAAFLRAIFNWRSGGYWYGLVFALPLLVNAAAMIIAIIITEYRPSTLAASTPLTLLVVYLAWQILTSGMQEPAWRGFALPLLEKRFSAEKATWLIGLAWAVWHYPLVIVLNFDQGLLAILVNLIGFTLTLIGWSFVLTWILNSTGSIWLVILLQGWSNTVNLYLITSFFHPLVPFVHAAVIWLLAVSLLRTFGGGNCPTVRSGEVKSLRLIRKRKTEGLDF